MFLSGPSRDKDAECPRAFAGGDLADKLQAVDVQHGDLVAEPVGDVYPFAVGTDNDAFRKLADRYFALDRSMTLTVFSYWLVTKARSPSGVTATA